MDKIADIIEECINSSYSANPNHWISVSDAVKQIRQQIGRELFERHHQGWVHSDDIKEVCKLPPFDKNVETVSM